MDPVAICNMALGAIGATRIVSLADPTLEAELCSDFYGPAVRKALSERAWAFATGPVALENPGASGDPDLPVAFALPTTVISVVRLAGDVQPRWERRGNLLVTEAGVARQTAICVRYDADPARWTPTFCWAVAYLIASNLAGPIAKSEQIAIRMEERYERELKKAGVYDAMQGNAQPRLRLDPRRSPSWRR